MAQDERTHSLEEKFCAAVQVVWGLPEEGAFQPSEDLMLSFHSYYQQATQGPCNTPRPTAFWDARGKAGWDAWSSLGNMPKQEAMEKYVEDLQLILETIPVSDNVSDLLQKLGTFYTEVDGEEGDAGEPEVDRTRFTRPLDQETDDKKARYQSPTMEGFGGLWDDIQDVQLDSRGVETDHRDIQRTGGGRGEEEEEKDWDFDLRLMERWSCPPRGCSNILVHSGPSLVDGALSSVGSELEGGLPDCSTEPSGDSSSCDPLGGSDQNHRPPHSDQDEFCDSVERQEEDPTPPGPEPPSAHVLTGSYLEGAEPCRWARGTGPRPTGGGASQSDHPGGGGVSQQMAAALQSLQDDMGAVLRRLDGLEAQVSRLDGLEAQVSRLDGLEAQVSRLDGLEAQVSRLDGLEAQVSRLDGLEAQVSRLDGLEAQVSRLEAQVSQLDGLEAQVSGLDGLEAQVSRLEAQAGAGPSWWPFDLRPLTVLLAVWPLAAHWLVQVYLQRRTRRNP
ncbi:acyl-CoA-binding domain-containing protein 5-B-like isoform X2 [Antennarius striatus]|uniref:acyl-CoA-binding domain-containing protein 5-B-like isoform X2 n=1 Tax=Antennarius striatus TaxID=241820 RepID=UPI0035B1955B